MGKAKKTLLAAVAVVVGIVTLKKFRSSDTEADTESGDESA